MTLSLYSIFQNRKPFPLAWFLNFQVKIVNAISFSVSPYTTQTQVKTVLPTKHFGKTKQTFLSAFQFAHIFAYFAQTSLLLKPIINDHKVIRGDTLVLLQLVTLRTYLSLSVFKFSKEKYLDFKLLCNSLFRIDFVQKSCLFKLIIINTPLQCTLISALYGIANIGLTANNIYFDVNAGKNFYKNLLTLGLAIFDSWSFANILIFASLFVYDGLVTAYVALYRVAKLVYLQSSEKPRDYNHIWKYIRQYREAQLYTGFVNFCFRETLAIPLKVVLVTISILFGTIVIEKRIRCATADLVIFMCAYCLVNAYLFMAVGYGLPGKVNLYSKKIIGNFKASLAFIRKYEHYNLEHKIIRKCITSCCDIRVRFGAANYYEKGTALMILRFLIESTVNSILLVQKPL